MMRQVVLSVLLFAGLAGAVSAKQPLREVEAIDNAVFDVAIADEIRKKCPDIAPRLVKAFALYRATQSAARDLGYSDAEIEAYVESEHEKARMRAKGEAYLHANGVVAADPQSYCALGRKEIEKSSRIGSVLRVK